MAVAQATSGLEKGRVPQWLIFAVYLGIWQHLSEVDLYYYSPQLI
jgi:hypothetical protein